MMNEGAKTNKDEEEKIKSKSSKIIEISSNSSMIELKAELMKKRQEFEAHKQSRKNKPLEKRKSPEDYHLTSTTSESRKKNNFNFDDDEELKKKSREALEAKARLYKRLERGQMMESDLNASQRENLMVDFAYKGWNEELQDFEFNNNENENDNDSYDSDSTDNSDDKLDNRKIYSQLEVDEMINESVKSDANFRDERWIEYEDEFGRLRVCKLTELIEQRREREEVFNKLRSQHYDGDAEIRNKGVAFYRFASDESERKSQMAQLKKLREETLEKRMRALLMKEERRLFIEERLRRIKERREKEDAG